MHALISRSQALQFLGRRQPLLVLQCTDLLPLHFRLFTDAKMLLWLDSEVLSNFCRVPMFILKVVYLYKYLVRTS